MCTIIVLNRVRQDYPVVLATNRDELFARPATGPERLLDAPPAVGGRDLRAGGTWMGVTATGFFAGLTNQRSFGVVASAPRSRGELVIEALRRADTDAARRYLEAVDVRELNEFNMLFGTARGMWLAYGRRDRPAVQLEPLPVGLHVLPNGQLDAPEFPKCERARELVEPAATASWSELEGALRIALADRQTQRAPRPSGAPSHVSDALLRELSALCIRTPAYGTRSSTIVALAPDGVGHYLYADGTPDRTPFADVRGLFSAPGPAVRNG